MKPSLPRLQRCLPPLLILACLAVAGCSATPTPGPTGAGSSPAANGAAGTGPGGAATAAASDGTAVKSASTGQPQAASTFRGSIATGRDAVRNKVRWSWRRGCPVGPVELRLLRADYWGFDKRVHRGELIVHRDHARRVLVVLEKLFKAGYPIERLKLVDAYRADDDRSMAANNTSGFNCRRVSGSSSWSEHAFGRAIDLNPLRNPYVTRGGRLSPPAGRPYANRAGGPPG
jgi:D-alanyl-D-alanine carboxypeptidase